MKINQTKLVEVEAKTMRIHVKCCDRFTYSITDQSNDEIFRQEDGYVPGFMPGEHFGDYIILDIDLDTGLITNWEKPTADQIEKAIASSDE